MKHRRLGLVFVAACLLSLLAGQLSAAVPSLRFLPVVANGAVVPLREQQIYACQCGAVIATAIDDTHVLLTIQDHSRGGAIVVGIDNGTTFEEIEGATTTGIAPAFQFPGEKQGIGSSVKAFGKYVTYAPNRTEEGGRYNIWRFVYPIP